jgi:predicted HTH transcriptional regulator
VYIYDACTLVGFTFLKLEYTDVLTRLNWSESNDLEFKPDFVKDDKVESKIFDTLIAMSNTKGGNIVIGLSEPQNSPREIKGTNRSEIEIGDRLSHMIKEYVDPPTLVTDVYSIQSLDKP